MRTTIDSAGRVVIPKRLRDEVGLGAGQEVDIEVLGAGLRLEPVVEDPPTIVERNGRPVLAAAGRGLTVDEVDRLRDAIRR
jgi:AbrB family looped-hinge helix DNA binding protein